MKLGIIGAMEVEVDALKKSMENKVEKSVAGSLYCEGTLAGLDVVVVQCGVGKVNAALCVQVLSDIFGVTHIVNTGVAGSLSAQLDIGDFVISTDAVQHDFDITALGYTVGQIPGLDVREFPADEMLMGFAFGAADEVNPGHAHMGRIASGDQFVSGKSAKEKILGETQAMCTEMEGAAIAQAAYRNQIPFVILRAISDKADDSAHMDYPTFEAIAAKRSSQVTTRLAALLYASMNA